MKTLQETFDTVAKAILNQNGEFAYDATPGISKCYYRLKKDNKILKCAAGHLIPDEKYIPAFDHFAVLADRGPVADILKEGGYDPLFVRELQSIHDTCADRFSLWKIRMIDFANRTNLNSDVFKSDISA